MATSPDLIYLCQSGLKYVSQFHPNYILHIRLLLAQIYFTIPHFYQRASLPPELKTFNVPHLPLTSHLNTLPTSKAGITDSNPSHLQLVSPSPANMYFQLQPTHRRSSSGHYPLTPPTCAPASLNKSTSSVSKHSSQRDNSASAMLSKMATGRSSPTRSPATSPHEYPSGETDGSKGEEWSERWSDKQQWQRESGYVSFPDFEGYYQGCEQREVQT